MQPLRRALRPLGFAKRNLAARAKRSLVGANVSALLIETKQGIFLDAPEDQVVGKFLIRDGAYGLDEIERIRALVTPESRVLFVGTHIGALAIPVSRFVRHVTAIEANPNTYRLLSWNILLNERANMNAIHIAASDKREELEFVLNTTNSGGSKRMPHVHSENYFHDHPAIARVSADRLDDVLPENYDLIVMDIEGSEYFALKGMARLLSAARHLILEFVPDHLKNVANVSVEDLVALLELHFSSLQVPSTAQSLARHQFLPTLRNMYQSNKNDEGLIFSK